MLIPFEDAPWDELADWEVVDGEVMAAKLGMRAGTTRSRRVSDQG
jgi:hypothetical protein